jgi:hypothetical protein
MVRALVPVVLLLAALAVRADPPHARKPAPVVDEGLEALAERLALRLGAQRSTTGDGSFVIRVPARKAPPAQPADPPARRPAIKQQRVLLPPAQPLADDSN